MHNTTRRQASCTNNKQEHTHPRYPPSQNAAFSLSTSTFLLITDNMSSQSTERSLRVVEGETSSMASDAQSSASTIFVTWRSFVFPPPSPPPLPRSEASDTSTATTHLQASRPFWVRNVDRCVCRSCHRWRMCTRHPCLDYCIPHLSLSKQVHTISILTPTRSPKSLPRLPPLPLPLLLPLLPTPCPRLILTRGMRVEDANTMAWHREQSRMGQKDRYRDYREWEYGEEESKEDNQQL
ncbi:hypothetical protein BDV96DRAFT_144162 [Lophiotrema nucula]|uniref:Uncharacterized protein n=1 Tax=Lophiotrema nucula TaxID=690887 RepID=A0A6A5ZTR2_9PLEO|nr:hypothetical protein BDV96DRAFT_144162 [Lophiotrema nucula]